MKSFLSTSSQQTTVKTAIESKIQKEVIAALADKIDILSNKIPTAENVTSALHDQPSFNKQLRETLLQNGWIDQSVPLAKIDTTMLPEAIRDERRDEVVNRGWNEIRSVVLDKGGKLQDYSGNISHDKKLIILIGLPASGKSTVANILSAREHARVLDNDEYKKMFPEYADGFGSSLVHEESQDAADIIFKKAMAANENIVLPKVGGNPKKMEAIVQRAKAAGYTVSVQYVDLAWNKSLSRMLSRFNDTQRLLPLNAMFKNFNMPIDKGIDEFAHLEIEATQNDSIDGQRDRLQKSLQGSGWTLTPDVREGTLDLTWNAGHMDLDLVLNKAKSMGLEWAKLPKEGLKDPIWQMLLPERALASACMESSIRTVSQTIDDRQCYKINQTFEHLKTNVLSLAQGDSFARWDTDVGLQERPILKEHDVSEEINRYAIDGRLLKAEELNNAVLRQDKHRGQSNVQGTRNGGDDQERVGVGRHDVGSDRGTGPEVRAKTSGSRRSDSAHQSQVQERTLQSVRVTGETDPDSGRTLRPQVNPSGASRLTTSGHGGVHPDVRSQCWALKPLKGKTNAFYFRFVPSADEASRIKDFLSNDAPQYMLSMLKSCPGICCISSNDEAGDIHLYKQQERRISDFLNNSMNYEQVSTEKLKERRDDDLKLVRHGPSRSR